MSSQQLDPDADKAATDQAAGVVLARAREAAEVTPREIADALNLPVATILAIETDDQSQLPARVFTRGYIRAYAKLLDIDPEPLVSSMGQDLQVEAEDERPPERSVFLLPKPGAAASLLTHQLSQPKFLLGTVVVLGFFVLMGVLFFGGFEDVPTQGAASDPVAESVEVIQADTVVDAPAAGVVEPRQQDEAVGPVATDEQPVVVEALPDDKSQASDMNYEQVEQPEVAEVASTVTAKVGVVQQSGSPRRLTPTGEDRLSLEFTEECWVDIKGTDGVSLYANLGRPGRQMEFVGAAPFRVLLGYAPGVLLKFNAEPVALAPHTRNNVASLVIGQ